MASGQNVEQFGKALKARVADQEKLLPAGFDLSYVTFQADVVKHEMGKMNHVMMETIIVVLGVVVLFLGWRTGIIVGMIVPLTILSALIVMRAMNIELQNVSMGAIIIALGLLVDNGIVIAEDIERRLAGGEDRKHACLEAGRTLAIPLLTSSLVIVIVFSPFFWPERHERASAQSRGRAGTDVVRFVAAVPDCHAPIVLPLRQTPSQAGAGRRL